MKTKLAWYSAASLACLAVFLAYLRPDMVLTLAQQVWACF
jgi:hypothetical protein